MTPRGGDGPRVLIHAGFHKTGTTSLQAFLSANRAALSPYFAFYHQPDMPRMDASAQTYGQKPFPWRLRAFRKSLRQFLVRIPTASDIVLSCETFSGAMPGHRNWRGTPVTSYQPTALPIAHALMAELHRRIPSAQIEFLYTTRDRDAWLASVHGHLLRSIKLDQTFDAFRDTLTGSPGPTAEAATLARNLPVPVHIRALEDLAQHRHGPAQAVLDLFDVPPSVRDALSPARCENIGQSAALRDGFLALNRGAFTGAALKAAKEDMMAEARP